MHHLKDKQSDRQKKQYSKYKITAVQKAFIDRQRKIEAFQLVHLPMKYICIHKDTKKKSASLLYHKSKAYMQNWGIEYKCFRYRNINMGTKNEKHPRKACSRCLRNRPPDQLDCQHSGNVEEGAKA